MSTGDSTFSLPQYQALRDGCGFVELAGWSSVTVTGADRQAFLQSFCTNDVGRLAIGQNCEAFFTNVKGRILAHGLVTCREAEMVFIAVPNQAARLVEHLDRYIIREDVQLRDTTANRSYLLVSGGATAREVIPEFVEGDVTRWIAWDLLARPVCGLMETASAHLIQLRQLLVDRGATPGDPPTIETLRVEAGMPLFGIDFDEHNFPQEVARNDLAISFTKGCYLGQETVARIDALGHVNQQLAGVQFDGSTVPQPGMELTEAGAAAGKVTTATFSPQLSAPLALSMVRREWHQPGSEFDSSIGACRVVALPIGRAAG